MYRTVGLEIWADPMTIEIGKKVIRLGCLPLET